MNSCVETAISKMKCECCGRSDIQIIDHEVRKKGFSKTYRFCENCDDDCISIAFVFNHKKESHLGEAN